MDFGPNAQSEWERTQRSIPAFSLLKFGEVPLEVGAEIIADRGWQMNYWISASSLFGVGGNVLPLLGRPALPTS